MRILRQIKSWRSEHKRQSRIGHRAAKTQLKDAQIWCSAKADPANPKTCLRSEELKPGLLNTTRLETVDEVRDLRERSVKYQFASLKSADDQIGRLLVYCPDMSLNCGTAESLSGGFFDVDNTPAWDTWVALVHRRDSYGYHQWLIAWIPSVLLPLVQAGMDAIPEECIFWLDSDPALKNVWADVVSREQETL
jgi:hypothetical protein